MASAPAVLAAPSPARRIGRVTVALALALVLFICWNVISNWLQGFFGFRDGAGNGSHYLFWSGAGSDLAYIGWVWAGGIYYRKNNCRKTWCPWLGHHDFTDPLDGVTRRLCDYHHPDVVYQR